MATRKSSIGAELVIDRRKFKAALEASKGDAVAFARSLEAIKAPRSGVLAPTAVSDSKWTALGGKMTVARGVAEGVAQVFEKLGEPQKVEMEFETALAGLSAVQDGTETLAVQLKALNELGEKPGLGFQQVMEASVGLQAVGQNAAEARKTMEQFGNAVALVGGGKQEFSEVMVSLRQILSTGSVDMTNLKEIASRIPQFLTIAQSLDRSSAPKFVEAAVEKLKELPRAATTAQEALGNLDDAWKKKYIETSDGALVANVKARVERSMEQLKQGGMHTAAAKIAEVWGGIEAAASGGAVKLTDIYETPKAELARRQSAKREAEEARKAADEKTKADKAGEGLTTLEAETKLSNLALQIEEARAEGDDAKIESLEDQVRLLTDVKEIVEKTGLAEEVVAEHLKTRADNLKEIERLQSQSGQGKFAGDAKEQMEIDRLRSRGKNKQADKLEKDRSLKNRTEQLMKEGGLSETAAKKMAGEEQRIQEDADYLARTGKKKMRGAVSDNRYRGLDDYHPSDRLMGMSDEWSFDKLDAMKADRKNRPLKSQLDREARKPSIKPDATSGMSQKQADEMLEVLRAIRSATESNQPTVAQKTSSR